MPKPKPNGLAKAIIAALEGGKSTTIAALEKKTGADAKSISSIVGYLKRRGRVDYVSGGGGRGSGGIDWSTLRLVERQSAKPIKARAVAPSVARRAKRKVSIDTRPTPTPPIPTDDLRGAPVLILSRDEIARIRALVGNARAACDELETLATRAERGPTAGRFLRLALDRLIPGIDDTPSSIDLWSSATASSASVSAPAEEAPRHKRASRPRTRRVPDILEPPTEPVEKREAIEEKHTVPPASSAPFVVLNGAGARLTACNTREEADRYVARFVGAHRILNAIGDVVWTRKAKVA